MKVTFPVLLQCQRYATTTVTTGVLMAPYRTKAGSFVHLMRTCPRTIGTVVEKRDNSTVVHSGTSKFKT